MALFRIGGCLVQVVLTECRGGLVPDLEEVVEELLAIGALPRGLRDCGAVARLVGRAVEEATGCRCLAEPFPRESVHGILALRLG